MEFGEIGKKVRNVLDAIGREMDRWDEADRRLGNRVWAELNPPQVPSSLAEDLSIMGSQCRDYGSRGIMERARELRAYESELEREGRSIF